MTALPAARARGLLESRPADDAVNLPSALFNPSRDTLSLFVVSYLMGLVMLMTAGIYDGPLAEPALFLAFACLALLLVQFGRLLSAKASVETSLSRRWLLLIPIALAVFSVATLEDQRLLIDSDRQPRVIHVLKALEIVLLGTYVPSLWQGTTESPRWRTLRFTLFALILVVGGITVLHLSPSPHIDTWKVHDAGAKALLHGQNPYVDVHVEETAGAQRVIAFVYPPTPCYLNALAFALGKDVRWGMLTALVVTGWAMRVLARGGKKRMAADRPSLLEDAPALFLWLTPKTFFFLEQGWNDIYPLAFVALALAAHAREKRYATAICLGLALSCKQTMVWFVPLGLLLDFGLGQWIALLGVASATAVPFLVADVVAFKLWVFDMYVHYPPRLDALSAMNFCQRHFGVTPRSTPGILLAASCTLLAAWRAPHTRHAFALASTLAVFLFFFFNIWMFINSYFLVAGFALVAAATSIAGEPHGRSRETSRLKTEPA